MIAEKDGLKSHGAPHTYHTIKTIDGKYHIKNRMLGKGSFAETYLAVQIQTGQEIACKMISKKNLIQRINSSKNKALTKQYFINALKNQAKTWKLAKHQNIVQFKNFSETANNIYFFLEFCSQGNIESMLRNKGYIKQTQAIPILYQIAKGCQYLYEKGIFHRDIKTQNILISQNNMVKLTDFGFAKMVAEQQQKNSPSSQTSVGTPIFMSPQVILSEPYTIKCDVWSCGVVFYKILFTLFPWERTQNIYTLTNMMKKQITFPPHIQVSEWLKNLIKGMLTVEQENRVSIKDVVNIFNKNCQQLMDVQ